ncbi:hypothetical protein PybrP1_010303 [[Pythium] brassicae (nom. inval.)]|nr:hypothetical protein PybrP1_010303 [[Pythium] brassicae (nom. inval.)]
MSDHEQQLADEGGSRSFAGAAREEQQLAFLERFALAPDARAKREEAQHTLLAGSPEALYYGALCDLLEVQEALSASTNNRDGNGDRGNEDSHHRLQQPSMTVVTTEEATLPALQLLESKKAALLATATELESVHSCPRKAKRVRQRLLLLELELPNRQAGAVSGAAKTAASSSMELPNSMGLYFADSAPANSAFSSPSASALPSQFDQSVGHAKRSAAQTELRAMNPYARERFFERLAASDSRDTTRIADNPRWVVLEMFLEEFAFQCPDTDEFLELIVNDVKREALEGTNRKFNFRAAHEKLSLPQLAQLLTAEPALFQDNAPFAIRGVNLLYAAADGANKNALDRRDVARRARMIAQLRQALVFLERFSGALNFVRLAILHEILKQTQLQHWVDSSETELLKTLLEYLQIPRSGANHMYPGLFANVPSEHTVEFEYYGGLSHRQAQEASMLGTTAISSTSDRQAIEDALYALWSSEQVSASVEQLLAQALAEGFLTTVKAQCMLRAGRGDVSEWSKHLPHGSSKLAELAGKSELAFCESNPSYLGPGDALTVRVRVRNVKRLTVHLYELRTLDYYSRVRKEIRGDINLDGLLPNVEQTVDVRFLSPFHETRVSVSFPQVKSTRGVYVVEVLEGGQTCRAILRRGFLRHVERITDAGHELLVLDESGAVVRDAKALVLNLKSGSSRAQPGRTYAADADGKMLIPFRHDGGSDGSGPDDKFAIAFCHGEFAFFHQKFEYLTDSVVLQADMHIDSEQLVSGSTAQLIARPYLLQIRTRQEVSLQGLAQVRLTVKFLKADTMTANGSEASFEFRDMDAFLATEHAFEIPMDTSEVLVTLSARVLKRDERGELIAADDDRIASLPSVSCKKRFSVQHVTNYVGTYTPHLIRRAVSSAVASAKVSGSGSAAALEPASTSASSDGHAYEFVLLVLGHNGEAKPNVEVALTCERLHFSSSVTTTLQSDASGEIILGRLRDVQQICVSLPKSSERCLPWTWELPGLRSHQSRMVNCSVNEAVEIPVPSAFRAQLPAWVSKRQVGVYRLICGTKLSSRVLEAVSSSQASVDVVQNKFGESVLLKVAVRLSGEYVVVVRPLDLKFPITAVGSKVVDAPMASDVLIQQEQLLLATPSRPLMIVSQEVKRDDVSNRPVLEVQLRNFSLRSTRVIVTFRRFVDVDSAKLTRAITSSGSKKRSASDVQLPNWVFEATSLENEYLRKRKISDEYKYILERRVLTHENPRSLQTLGVSTLSKPSLLQTPHVVESTDMEEVVMGTPSTSFLGQPSQVVSTCTLSADGVVRVDLESLDFFKDGSYGSSSTFEVIVLGVDYAHGQVCSSETLMSLSSATHSSDRASSEITKRDVRLSGDEALSRSAHYLQTQLHEVVRAGEQRVLPRSSSSKYALYESVGAVMDLWSALCSSSGTRELATRLREWPTMRLDAKRRFYYANASDDLNVFLSRKDPAFAASYILPLVESKMSKSLIDYYLLADERALRELYLAPGILQRLSVIEKLLIAERLSSVEDGSVKPSDPPPPPPRAAPAPFILSQGSVKPSSPKMVKSAKKVAMNAIHIMAELALECGEEEGEIISNGAFNDTFGGMESTMSSIISSDDEDDGEDSDAEDESAKKLVKARKDTAYIPPGKVRTVREKRFFDGQRPRLDGRNQFWKAYAEHIVRAKSSASAREQGFASSFFPEALASASLNEGLLALAVLDLPMSASGSTEIRLVSPGGSKVELRPHSDVILYSQSIEGGACADEPNSTLILKQKIVNNAASEASAVLEFVVSVTYTCVVNASNVGSSELSSVNLLLQIPHGSIPLGSESFYMKSYVVDIPANHTTTKTVSFYFPETGEFEQFPAHAAVDGKVVAWADSVQTQSIRVLLQPTQVDLTSWSDVSARGSLDDVVGYLSTHRDMLRVDLSLLVWRCTDEAFYRGLTAFLRGKVVYDERIWKYAFVHRDSTGMREFLSSSSSLMESVGRGVETSLFADTELYKYESCFSVFDHTEFGPFLHRRVHKVSGTVAAVPQAASTRLFGAATSGGSNAARGARILNKSAREFYRSLCQRLGHFAALDGKHLLVLTHFMLAFNRLEDALALFARLEALPAFKKADVKRSVQYDYVDAYLDLFRVSEDDEAAFSAARRNVAKHKTHPHARWRERFVRLGEFVAEYDHYRVQRSKQAAAAVGGRSVVAVTAAAAEAPQVGVPLTRTLQVKLDASAADGKLELTSQHVGMCEVSFYPVDVEFMFSSEPFGTFSDSAASSSSLLLIQPREHLRVVLDGATPPQRSGGSNRGGGSGSGHGDSDNGCSTKHGEEEKMEEAATCTTTVVEIPTALVSQQMMIRVRESVESRQIESVAAPIDLMRSYFNSSLQVEVMKQSGVLQVFRAGLPVARCYVKVFAKVSGGASGRAKKAQFYKDGYTDLLGKFDYVGVNGELISRVERFSILVSHAACGASVHEVEPPVLATTAGDFQHQEEHELLLY